MKTENDCRCDKRINQLEEALQSIANGDIDCNGKWCAEQAKEAAK